MDTFDFILLSYDKGLNIPTTKQNNTDEKLDFSTGRMFVQCDKSENTKLSILIKYILNSSA